MLGQDIQTALRGIGLFYEAFPGHLRRHAAEYALGSCSGKKVHDAGKARIVSGPAQPLHGTGDGAGTTHLQYLTNLTNVDAKFHGGGGAQKTQPALPQSQFRLGTLFF